MIEYKIKLMAKKARKEYFAEYSLKVFTGKYAYEYTLEEKTVFVGEYKCVYESIISEPVISEGEMLYVDELKDSFIASKIHRDLETGGYVVFSETPYEIIDNEEAEKSKAEAEKKINKLNKERDQNLAKKEAEEEAKKQEIEMRKHREEIEKETSDRLSSMSLFDRIFKNF